MMANADRILDAITRHAINMERYSSGVIRRMLTLIAKAETDIVAQVQERLRGVNEDGFDLNPEENGRLKALQTRLQEINRAAHAELLSRLTGEAVDMGEAEASFSKDLYTIAGGVNIELGKPTVTRIKAIVTAQPFQGRVLKDWAANLESGMLRRVKDQINLGLVQGESTEQIVRRIRGSKQMGYRDGVIRTSEHGATSLVRTVSTHVQVRVHEETLRLNPRVFTGVRWVSVLDSHTTAGCRARDGEVYQIGAGPRPPGHWGCRSRVVGVLKYGEKPKLKTYGEWLKEQPRATVEDIMGKTKAKLFLDGMLPLKGFVNRVGDELTLQELKARDAAMFEALGL